MGEWANGRITNSFSPFANSQIRHSPFAIRHSPFAIRHSPFAIRHSPFAIRKFAILLEELC
ncbi:MAG TPA: hypothetical protein G4N96_02770 [Chloroflexi bacterium]|nr:hypothetical protein [Chloroflexota bacterium]